MNNSFFQLLSKLTMSTFIVIKSKSKLCNRTIYIRKFKLTFFAFRKIYHIVRITVHLAFKNVKSFFWLCFLNFVVSLTELHTSHEWFAPSHGLDLPSLSNWGQTVLTKWSLRLLTFLKPTIATSEKILLWAWSGVSKRGNSLRSLLTSLKAG